MWLDGMKWQECCVMEIVSLNVKRNFVKTAMRPTMMYGSEYWTINHCCWGRFLINKNKYSQPSRAHKFLKNLKNSIFYLTVLKITYINFFELLVFIAIQVFSVTTVTWILYIVKEIGHRLQQQDWTVRSRTHGEGRWKNDAGRKRRYR